MTAVVTRRTREQQEKEMKNWKLTAAKLSNPTALRVLYVLLALLAMALASGAPASYGGQ